MIDNDIQDGGGIDGKENITKQIQLRDITLLAGSEKELESVTILWIVTRI